MKYKGKSRAKPPFWGVGGGGIKDNVFIAVYTNKYKNMRILCFLEKNKYTNALYFRIKCYICSGNYILSICR